MPNNFLNKYGFLYVYYFFKLSLNIAIVTRKDKKKSFKHVIVICNYRVYRKLTNFGDIQLFYRMHI